MQKSKDTSLCIDDPNATIKGLLIDPDFEMIVIAITPCIWNCTSDDVAMNFWNKTSLTIVFFQNQVDF